MLVAREPNGRPTWVGLNIKKQPQNVVFLYSGEVHLMSQNGSDGEFSVRVTEAQLLSDIFAKHTQQDESLCWHQ